ncbi:MAG: ELM1/GtrOC1 family putative glycosyltransferase [Candidatus Omnitrophota bacterium]|nr:ELM1/GtrOC1 family putative glycosyltransferase [Candidatus Omnitrophota bacterium]
MNRDSVIDYCACILVKLVGFFIRRLPKNFSLFLGRRLGDLFFCFDLKHKAIAYSNIKTALESEGLLPSKLSKITREFYQAFGQNLIEIFFVPLIDKNYLDKYVAFEGLENISISLKKGKGAILLVVHEGSWELSNVICANLGFPFVLFGRAQKYPRLNELLNSYRKLRSSKVIQRKGGVRQLIEALKDNYAVGMTLDQGGKKGALVKFFNKKASFATGALRLGLKYDTAIIPAFYTRVKGPFLKIFIESAFEIRKTGDLEKDLQNNLERLVGIYEKYIFKYPREYLWTYKIWKYAIEKKILILSDGKAGHNQQAQSASNLTGEALRKKGFSVNIRTQEIRFKNKFSKYSLILSSCLAGKYICQGCLWCLKTFLKKDVYKSLLAIKPDIIISCGGSIAAVNFVLSQENLAKSIVVMRPSVLSVKRFDLVIMPKHDFSPKRKNVIATEGALNLINEEYLKEQSESLIRNTRNPSTEFILSEGEGLKAGAIHSNELYIGLLIGGDTKNFILKKEVILEVIKQIKAVCETLNAQVLITTSRRSSKEIEVLIKREFKDYSRCKLLIIANERNIPQAIGGLLGLTKIIITSPDSISMISEAVSSNRYVLVFKVDRLDKKHKGFLIRFHKNKYIYLIDALELAKKITDIWRLKPLIHTSLDNLSVFEAIKRVV